MEVRLTEEQIYGPPLYWCRVDCRRGSRGKRFTVFSETSNCWFRLRVRLLLHRAGLDWRKAKQWTVVPLHHEPMASVVFSGPERVPLP